MIVINWGTSKFRAYKLDLNGDLQAERTSARGAATVAKDGFPDAVVAEVGDWIRAGESQLLMSGMVGSRLGWKEAPYVQVPAVLEQIASRVIPLEVGFVDARIVPGLIGMDEAGIPEVIRGEETEIMGTNSALWDSRYLCLPGTHTKWVRMEYGTIAEFSTSMMGDLFRAICERTILHSAMSQIELDQEAFLEGVARSMQPGELLHHLFGVRTLVLAGRMQESSSFSYLSGLLIGHDIKPVVGRRQAVHLIGDPNLCVLYSTALHRYDVLATVEEPGAALRGLKRIAARLKW